jgi:tRNA G18 (ribose-2'-O)-methylase SpoU
MPNVNRIISPFLGGTGNPDTYTETASTTPGSYSPYAGGDLGTAYDTNDRTYQKVTLDSGATSATPAGAVAANQLAYWKDRSNYIVTNDSRFALFAGTANSFRNNVAGLFRSAVAAGANCFILQRGRQVNVKEVGSATTGMLLVASTSTTAADALGVAINTAAPCMPLGVVTTATSGTTCVADFDIPNIP